MILTCSKDFSTFPFSLQKLENNFSLIVFMLSNGWLNTSVLLKEG